MACLHSSNLKILQYTVQTQCFNTHLSWYIEQSGVKLYTLVKGLYKNFILGLIVFIPIIHGWVPTVLKKRGPNIYDPQRENSGLKFFQSTSLLAQWYLIWIMNDSYFLPLSQHLRASSFLLWKSLIFEHNHSIHFFTLTQIRIILIWSGKRALHQFQKFLPTTYFCHKTLVKNIHLIVYLFVNFNLFLLDSSFWFVHLEKQKY